MKRWLLRIKCMLTKHEWYRETKLYEFKDSIKECKKCKAVCTGSHGVLYGYSWKNNK